MPPVSRETLDQLAAQHALGPTAAVRLGALLDSLAAEPDPYTTVSDPRRAVDVHIRDSLSPLGLGILEAAGSIADIGAGAGFPGLPLAIALPGARVDLIESAGRKCAVIDRLASAAGIPNAQSAHARAEEWASGDRRGSYDVATARAVAPLPVLVEYAAPLLRVDGTFIAWKGARDEDDERAGATAAAELGLEHRETVAVTPFAAARDLHLHVYSKVRETPAKFPRRPGMAAKRPLGARKQPKPPLT
jgi:16S rRNA (guanine527-N7)-methyltransferase